MENHPHKRELTKIEKLWALWNDLYNQKEHGLISYAKYVQLSKQCQKRWLELTKT